MSIRRLPEHLVNRIAAGEVVERPASALKELVENAIDAGAGRIAILLVEGGTSRIEVADDGCGMTPADMMLALERHATSKMPDEIIESVVTLGFRGEALPSIGSVAKLTITSRRQGSDSGSQVSVTGGKTTAARPAPANPGTVVEVRDIFFATPARLKFLKTERAEAGAITEIVKRMAIAFPHVRFVLSGSDRTTLDLPATGEDHLARMAQVLGAEFRDNAIEIEAMREDVGLTGFIGLPTFHRGNSGHQYAFVNGRPVQDKLILSAIRGAYAERMPSGRYPVAVLSITLDPALVDVNVHPAKADVRFRDPGLVRGLIVGAIREALHREGDRANTTGASGMMQAFRPGFSSGPAYRPPTPAPWSPAASPSRPLQAPFGFGERAQQDFDGLTMPAARTDDAISETVHVSEDRQRHRLGAARAQVHENYIVAQTENGLVIVDQHAAHERLVYEALRQALNDKRLASQVLLIPEIVDLPEEECDRLMLHAEELDRLGLAVERFGPGAVAVRETPAMLGEVDASSLIRDLADEVAEWGTAGALRGKLEYVAATMACHGSVRSGRRLRPDEMNALLRQMEATPGSGTCNHGRPTYIELKLSDIERLFGRT